MWRWWSDFAVVVNTLILIFYVVFWVFHCGLSFVKTAEPNVELEIARIQEPLPEARGDDLGLEKSCEAPD